MPSTLLKLLLTATAVCGLLALTSAARPACLTIATFSVVAYNPATGEVGAAVQSKFFAVGSVVPWARAGVGAVASQAYGNPTYGERGLKLMAGGEPAQEAIRSVLRGDKDAQRRQIGMVSVADERAGDVHRSGVHGLGRGQAGVAPDGVVYAVQGNILTGEDVVDAMAARHGAAGQRSASGAERE